MAQSPIRLPANGTPKHELLRKMSDLTGEEINEIVKEAYTMFFHENGLSPMAFPSLRKFETEVIAMTADLLGGGPEAAGSMTSGGSESTRRRLTISE